MASRDRPHRQEKKKPKDAAARTKIQPLLEPPTNVEVWKPKRKPRTERPRAESRADAIRRPLRPSGEDRSEEQGGDDRARD